ncbi:MAG: helix-turn-helix domain-containing protein [Anaeroplasmataceae bacterium]|nr:helix-turn-helix domain-containing protein [Anaeroplasmataceae bacterium]MDE6414545.1 helix-turn-helix domain-containing protein [Anaeroplasmataceae bacterium]
MDRIKMGNFLIELRKEKDLSQTDLAEIIGVTFQAVSKWERGEAIPDISILEKLASFYGITIDEIIKGEALVRQTGEAYKLEGKADQTVKKENEFLKQKRIFGFWFSLAYFLLFFLIGFCPFASAHVSDAFLSEIYISANYYQIIFSSNYGVANFIFLVQFLTTLGITASTLLFYACTSKKAICAMYRTRFVLIIINLLTLLMNCIVFITSPTVGVCLMFILILAFDILFLCLKPNRKSYILQDYQ